MSKTLLIVIIVSSVVLLFGLLFLFGKLSSARKKKKTMTGELAKKIAKIKKEQKKAQQSLPQPKEPFSLEEKKYIPDSVTPEKKHGKVTPIISDYDEGQDGVLSEQKIEHSEPVKRKSFEEIMQARAQNKVHENLAAPAEESDDGFEEFQAQHSIYTSYKKDQALINEIQNMSPELKAVVFGNLFRRISDD